MPKPLSPLLLTLAAALLARPAYPQGQIVTLETVQGMVLAAAFSPDGKRLAAGGMDKTARIWDLDKQDKPLVLDRQPATIRGLAFAPDGKAVCTAADFGTVALWDAGTGKARWTVKLDTDSPRAAFSPDGKLLAVAGSGGGKDGMGPSAVYLLDAATGKGVRTLKPDDELLLSVAFAPDGKTVAAGGVGGAHLWDVETGRHRRTLTADRKADRFAVEGLAFSPDGRRVYGAGGTKVQAWDPATGEEKLRRNGLPGGTRALALSADGKRLAVGGDTGHRPLGPKGATAVFAAFAVWDTASGDPVSRFQGGQEEDIGTVWGLAVSPDGKTLACGSDGHLSLYNAQTGGRQRMLLRTVSRP